MLNFLRRTTVDSAKTAALYKFHTFVFRKNVRHRLRLRNEKTRNKKKKMRKKRKKSRKSLRRRKMRLRRMKMN